MITMAPVRHQTVLIKGGWNLVSPTLSTPPGMVRDVLNFECAQTGGMARIGGYEIYDGRPSPSSATYNIIQVVSFTNIPTVGQVVTQAVTAATGVIIYVGPNYLIVTKVTGTFNDTNALTTPGPIAVGTATTLVSVLTSMQDAQFTNFSADKYRADIGIVPGSGPIRGVVGGVFSGADRLYAFRDNAGGTAVNIYKDSAGGWVQVPLGLQVAFTAGGGATPAVGATLTQGGVTALITRVVTETGADPWTGTSAGYLVIAAPSGGNFAAGGATATGGVTLTLSGIQTAITLLPGGKFQFDKGNFGGQTSRIYGVDGVNRAFEFDGTVLVPINSGLPVDTPKHIAVHKNHLFLSYESRLVGSEIDEPFKWTSTGGATDFAAGDTITNLIRLPGDQTASALAVTGLNNFSILYGNDAADFNLVPFKDGIGAIEYSGQVMNEAFVLDNQGVTSLRAAQVFGNFSSTTMTQGIKPFIDEKRTKVAYSSLSREKNQYRLFFNDGYGLYVTIVNGKYFGATAVNFPNIVFCAWEGERLNGQNVIFLGAASGGKVYQLDVGSSFDGENIDAYITTAWNAVNSPRVLKRFRRASIEMQGSSYAEIQYNYQLQYTSSDVAQPEAASYLSGFQRAPNWDTFVFDNFYWDGRTLAPTDVEVMGTAENIQSIIGSGTDYIYPYTINSIIYSYSMRRSLR